MCFIAFYKAPLVILDHHMHLNNSGIVSYLSTFSQSKRSLKNCSTMFPTACIMSKHTQSHGGKQSAVTMFTIPLEKRRLVGFLHSSWYLNAGRYHDLAWVKGDVVFHHAEFLDERRSLLLPGDVLDLSFLVMFLISPTRTDTASPGLLSVHEKCKVVDPAELAVHGQLGNN